MSSLSELMESGLPINRKERFYTGTVFPMIVCRDGFRYFSYFTDLIDGYRSQPLNVMPENANVQFFTEYGLAESLLPINDERFHPPPTERDTPDILIYIRGEHPILIALEAKMYLAPAPTALQKQMERQGRLLDDIGLSLSIASDDIYHAALVPKQWKAKLAGFKFPVITWQDLYKQFVAVIPDDYFLEVLKIALDKYDNLVSQNTTGGKYSETKLTGEAIYQGFNQGTLKYVVMGCQGGLHGSQLRTELEGGKWRKRKYEVNSMDSLPGTNWFYISKFVAQIDAEEE